MIHSLAHRPNRPVRRCTGLISQSSPGNGFELFFRPQIAQAEHAHDKAQQALNGQAR